MILKRLKSFVFIYLMNYRELLKKYNFNPFNPAYETNIKIISMIEKFRQRPLHDFRSPSNYAIRKREVRRSRSHPTIVSLNLHGMNIYRGAAWNYSLDQPHK